MTKPRSFSTCAGAEAQPERRAPVLIPLSSPQTREDFSRFPLHVCTSGGTHPFHPPHVSRLSLHSSGEHLQSLHPTPKACKKGETLFVKTPWRGPHANPAPLPLAASPSLPPSPPWLADPPPDTSPLPPPLPISRWSVQGRELLTQAGRGNKLTCG
ncbi:hypothetical protein NQZ68_039786 [Dissostichus eleginoides]|nr:hypothetical protein NQZ68_039786 [Dissostichus eleginoides]